MLKVDAGTQDYSGYFPDKSLATNKFDLVPRVNPELIQRRNESLVQQALKTRVLMAIPRNKIKPKRVPKASFMHVQGGVIKSKQKLRQSRDEEDNLFGELVTGQVSEVKGTAPAKKVAVKKKRVPIVIQQQEFVYPAELRGQAATTHGSQGTTPSSAGGTSIEKQLNRLSVSAAKPI